MQENKLSVFKKQVEKYFQLEFSDLALKQILGNLPETYFEKVEEVIELHYRNNKLQANAASYTMRILRHTKIVPFCHLWVRTNNSSSLQKKSCSTGSFVMSNH